MFVQLCFPVLQTEKNVKVLTVVLRRHMSEEEGADLASSTFSSNDTHIFFRSEKKRIVSKKQHFSSHFTPEVPAGDGQASAGGKEDYIHRRVVWSSWSCQISAWRTGQQLHHACPSNVSVFPWGNARGGWGVGGGGWW